MLSVRRLRDPSEEELRSCANVLDRAFNHEFYLSAFGGDRSKVVPALRVFVDSGVMEGQIWVVDIAGEGIVGVAVWYGPGKQWLETQPGKDLWYRLMQDLPQDSVAWWIYYTDLYNRFTDDAFGPGVKLGSYHLQLFGVSPGHHRKGVATALIRAVDQIALSTNTAMTVETSHLSVVPIYEKFGFTLVGSQSYIRADGTEGVISALIKRSSTPFEM